MAVDLGIPGLTDVEEVGRGGSSRVFKAHQAEMDRWVAVKVLHSAWDEAVQRRFDRERKAMGRLTDHPGIVPILTSGKTANDEPYLLMPFYPDGSLDDLVKAGPAEWPAAVSMISAVAETMADAHDAGIVHRDLKPANVMIASNGQPRVADFGISRLASDETASQSAALTFTPAYSPPESFRDSKSTPSTDVYGLAATLWALLAGRPPFTGEGLPADVVSMISRVANDPVEDLRTTVPAPLCAFIERSMAKDQTLRPSSGREFSEGLKEAVRLSESGASAPRDEIAMTYVAGAQTVTAAKSAIGHIPARVEQGPPAKSKRGMYVGAIAAAVVLFGAIGAGVAVTQADSGGGEDAAADRAEVLGETQGPDASDDDSESAGSEEPLEATNDGTDPGDESSGESASDTTESAAIQGSDGSTADRIDDVESVPATAAEGTTSSVDRSQPTTPQTAAPTNPPTVAPTQPPTVPRTNPPTVPPTNPPTQPPTQPPTVPPTDPPAPAIAVTNLRVVNVSDTSATVLFETTQCAGARWSTSGEKSGSSGYAAGGGDCWTSHTLNLGSSPYTNSALQPGTGYTVTVSAVVQDGTQSGSKSVSFTTKDKVTAPPSISGLRAVNVTATSATILWEVDQCTGNRVSVSNGYPGHSAGYPNSSQCWPGTHEKILGGRDISQPLTPETTYTVTVQNFNADGLASATRSVTFTTAAG